MHSLEGYLEEFNEVTTMIIEQLKADNLDMVDELLELREEIIRNIERENYDSENALSLDQQMKLVENDMILGDLIDKKKREIREDMRKLSNSRNANKGYNGYNNKNVIFSKKI